MAAPFPPHSQPGQITMDPLALPPPTISWEGDKMFNIYIYDYCNKRGFTQTAHHLREEAHLGADASPPINARQGLLFEWWSVFWVLFQAKSGNSTHEDALLYVQHQHAQKVAAQQRLQGAAPPPPPGQQQQQQQQAGAPMQPQPTPSNPSSQPAGNRMSNGMMQRQSAPYHANGLMSNGISPAMGGQPAHPGQVGPPGQPGPSIGFGMGGQNGLPGPQQPPPQQQGTQSMSFNPMMGGGSAQRPPINGQAPQPGQQQPGRGPFTSPPMAHAPQGGAGQPNPQGPPGQPGQQAPMAQLGPSPHMASLSRTMMPPLGAPSTGPGALMNLPNAPPGGLQSPAFNPGPGPTQGQQGPTTVRPPSRTRPSPSPSMSARQPPGAPGTAPQQAGMGMSMPMGGMSGLPAMGAMGGMPAGMGMPGSGQDINHEFSHIPMMSLNALKHDLGLGDKDPSTLSVNDKLRILHQWRLRNGPGQPQQQRKDSGPGPIPGGMLPPPPQVQGSQQQQRPSNRMKRNSSSPDESDIQRNESSPPERKRIKRSPPEQNAIPPGPSYPPHLPNQPPSSGGPPGSAPRPPSAQGPVPPPSQTPQQSGHGQPGSGSAVPQQMMLPQHTHFMQMRQHQMAMGVGNGPNPGGQGPLMQLQSPGVQAVMGMQMHPGQMQHPQQPVMFRPPGPGHQAAGPPPGFNATPLTRLGQGMGTKPGGMGPGPSPGMNGPQKDVGAKDNKPNGQPQATSPRNPPTGTSPPTPGRGGSAARTPPGPVSQVPPPPPPPPPPSGVSPMLSMSGMNPEDLAIFEPGFMDDFPDPGINFERDFGQWFNTAEDGSILES